MQSCLHTYIQTYTQTDRQTDIPCIHNYAVSNCSTQAMRTPPEGSGPPGPCPPPLREAPEVSFDMGWFRCSVMPPKAKTECRKPASHRTEVPSSCLHGTHSRPLLRQGLVANEAIQATYRPLPLREGAASDLAKRRQPTIFHRRGARHACSRPTKD